MVLFDNLWLNIMVLVLFFVLIGFVLYKELNLDKANAKNAPKQVSMQRVPQFVAIILCGLVFVLGVFLLAFGLEKIALAQSGALLSILKMILFVLWGRVVVALFKKIVCVLSTKNRS